MRAKMKILRVSQYETMQSIALEAVCKPDGYPVDGSDEDNSYAHFTPNARTTMDITNPNLHGKFKVGQTFYVDFTEATPQTDETKIA
jgi:hypothetical protein